MLSGNAEQTYNIHTVELIGSHTPNPAESSEQIAHVPADQDKNNRNCPLTCPILPTYLLTQGQSYL